MLIATAFIGATALVTEYHRPRERKMD